MTAPLVAVAGIAGTLLSALLSALLAQRAADNSRWREEERAEQLRERRSEAEERRSCYVALNTAARQYLAALSDHRHALGREEDLRPVRQRLTSARDLHRDVYAEVQMLLPERVLSRASEVSHALGALYGRLRRLDDGVPRPGDSLATARGAIDALWVQLREMRREMRADLGAYGARSGH